MANVENAIDATRAVFGALQPEGESAFLPVNVGMRE